MHPYEIQQHMRRRCLDRAFKLNFGSLYHAIESLLKAGHIETMETERDGRRPERTVYRSTASGNEAFRAQLSNLLSEPAVEFSRFEAGLSFVSHLETTAAVRLLRLRTDLLEADLGEGDAVMAALIEKGLSRLSLIEEEHSQALRRAEREWILRLIQEIEAGHIEWRWGFAEPNLSQVPALEMKEA